MKENMARVLTASLAIVSVVLFQNCSPDANFEEALSEENVASLSAVLPDRGANVIAAIDSAEFYNNQLHVKGWACQVGSDAQIKISLSATGHGHPSGYKFPTRSLDYIPADQPGEAAVAAVCQSNHGNHRFYQVHDFPDFHAFFAQTRPNATILYPNGRALNLEINVKSGPAPTTAGPVIGFVDEVREDQGQLLIRGWACAVEHENAIAVQLYSGGGPYQGFFVKSVLADVEREVEVATSCRTTSRRHGFEIRLNANERAFNQGAVFVIGNSPNPNGENPALTNSGNFRIF